MIIIFAILGYIVAYMILLMMWLTFMAGVVLSFGAYVVGYLALYARQAVAHRSTPEWRYNRKEFKPDMEKLQNRATGIGIGAMALMVLGFMVWALSGSLQSAYWTCGIVGSVAAFFAWDQIRSNDKRERKRVTYGEIRDRHGL